MIVKIDKDLEDIVPMFLENRQKDIQKINAFLELENYLEIARIGHSIKGTGGGYGFDYITELGLGIESNAKAKDYKKTKQMVDKLEEYINQIEIEYI